MRYVFGAGQADRTEAGQEQMKAKRRYDSQGNLIPLILSPPNKYGYRINVVSHKDGKEAYEKYRRERGHPLHFAESDEFRLAFEEWYISELYADLPPDRRPAELSEAYAAIFPSKQEEEAQMQKSGQ